MRITYALAVVLFGFFAFAISAHAVPLTVVTGTITDSNSSVVDGATVKVVCEHLGVNSTQIVSSGADGKYYAFFSSLDCNAGDTAWAFASKGGDDGSNSGVVSLLGRCSINVATIDVQIPEFGVIAGAVALLGAVAGFVIIRRK